MPTTRSALGALTFATALLGLSVHLACSSSGGDATATDGGVDAGDGIEPEDAGLLAPWLTSAKDEVWLLGMIDVTNIWHGVIDFSLLR